MENQLHHNILYSCTFKEKFENEQVTPEHALCYIQSGELHFYTPEGIRIFKEGDIGLIRRNHLVKSFKIPGLHGVPFRSVSLFLTQDVLREYAAEHGILKQEVYHGLTMNNLSTNVFIKAFFQSLMPYYEQPSALIKPMAAIKTKEAIQLLLIMGRSYKAFLFDFSEPYKIDLETFMIKNFEFNISMPEFARLSGRSISSFKRDFKKVFANSPEKWLLEKRLEKARYLITEKGHKPSDVYLRVGFQNLSHFSASFKTHFGYNPSHIQI